MIEIKNLRKEYPDVTPLKDVSVTIHDGDGYMYSCMLPGESKDADIWKDELQFSIQYHARACIYITKQWLEATNPISPVEIAERVYQNMPEPLKEALKERNRV